MSDAMYVMVGWAGSAAVLLGYAAALGARLRKLRSEPLPPTDRRF